MKFQISNRWSGAVQFETELSAEFDTSPLNIKLGAAIKIAYKSGADLTGADLTGADLTGADLTGAVLTDAVLRDAVLRDADLTGADLTGADLRGAVLTDAVLRDAVLRDAVLKDFAVPSLHRRILVAIEAGGTLNMETWHTCETTHCRAGWAIHLAGKVGRALEFGMGSAMAGAIIHLASCPELKGKVPNFYASNKDAMEDIKRCAEMEPLIGV